MNGSLLLTRRYLAEYARNPLNLVLLVVIPVIFVTLTAGALSDFAEIISGEADAGSIEVNTAGWAAAFIAGVAGYFQFAGSRQADRRLALAGTGSARVVAARLASSLVLVSLASAGALIALALRTGIEDVVATVVATLMFAVIYLAIGSAVGAAVRDEVNGSVIILFVWLIDVFLGPTIAGGDMFVTRLFPTHFVSLYMVDAASGHGGPLSDLAWALSWTFGALGVAIAIAVARTRPPSVRLMRHSSGAPQRLGPALRFGFVEYRRNVVLWVLLVIVPVIFITLSFMVTPDGPAAVELAEGGDRRIQILSMVDVHGAIMAPITVAFLAGLAGLAVVLGSAAGDRRLALTAYRAREILAARVGVIVAAAILVTVVSLVVTAADFGPGSWPVFVAGNVLVALTYGMLGVLVGPIVGRVGGLYLMFLVPFLDVGLAQNVMFDAAPPAWAKLMPAYGAVRVLIDGAFTASFDELGSLLLALGWLAAISAAALVVFHRIAEPERA